MSIAEKLTTIAENVPKVYAQGYSYGEEQGYYRGWEDAMNAAGGGGTDPTPTQEKTVDITENGTVEVTPDEGYALSKVTANVNVPDFWDVFQDNGNRTNYMQCFNGQWWTDETFKPKYPVTPDKCTYMFQASSITDVSKFTIDLSRKTSNTDTTRPFDESAIVTIGTIDLSNISGVLNTFFAYGNASNTKLETIQKLKLSETNTFGTNFFQNCVKLKNITIEGTIGNDLNMSACPLTTESVQSVIEHLKDLTGQTAKTLTLSSTVSANLTPAQTAMLAAKNWKT